jgi:hypothetical protein
MVPTACQSHVSLRFVDLLSVSHQITIGLWRTVLKGHTLHVPGVAVNIRDHPVHICGTGRSSGSTDHSAAAHVAQGFGSEDC